MRLIDGTALFRALREEKRLNDKEAGGFDEMAIGYGAGLTAAMEIVKAAPTIEPKRGRWIEKHEEPPFQGFTKTICSECGGEPLYICTDDWEEEYMRKLTNYCPNCGARMEGVNGEVDNL